MKRHRILSGAEPRSSSILRSSEALVAQPQASLHCFRDFPAGHAEGDPRLGWRVATKRDPEVLSRLIRPLPSAPDSHREKSAASGQTARVGGRQEVSLAQVHRLAGVSSMPKPSRAA